MCLCLICDEGYRYDSYIRYAIKNQSETLNTAKCVMTVIQLNVFFANFLTIIHRSKTDVIEMVTHVALIIVKLAIGVPKMLAIRAKVAFM